jgi:lipoprotein NlpD
MDSVFTRIIFSLLVGSLIACGSGGSRAPVEDRYANRSSSSSSGYTVQQGDTLYSIAFRYGLDFRKVAAANGIPAPYTIFPGQKIVLREAVPEPVVQVDPAPAAAARPPAVNRPTPILHTPAPTPSPAATQATAKPPSPVGPAVQKPRPVIAASPPDTAASTRKVTATTSTPVPAVGGPVRAWRWPTSGPIMRGYSTTLHKGIDIGGKRGDAIHAVADGTVVYSGTGIVGFGELLIVKHNDTYLSAYGHNDRLLVSENDVVRAGQKIAEKGSSGTDTVKLHFEIRKEGKPVDPQKLLPRR